LDNEKQALFAERVFDGRHWHGNTAVLIEGERIAAVSTERDAPAAYRVRRLPTGVFLAPGFIDLQVNGGGGILLNDDPSPEAMRAIARAHRRLGTTALLPTLITDARETMIKAIESASAVAGHDGVLGLHLEGPFINPARAGVHAREHIARAEMRDLELLRRLADAGRSLITVAPECVPGGFVRELVKAGIRVAAGHSEASADVMTRAMEEGLSGVTHLYNAMPPLQGRAPGIVGSAFVDRRVIAGVIVDGVHVDPISVRAAFAAKSTDGIALVTDAMPTVGGENDSFQLNGRSIALRDGRLQTDEGRLAGAHLDLVSAVRNAVTLCGVPLEHALRAASLTPARFLGLERERGALIPNARADLVALSADLHLIACWCGGFEVPLSAL
jgi:N-acetylglucosamine-6-phosphate deacetylase